MRSFQFNEDQLCDIGKLAQSMFQDEHDPRSSSYKRMLIRPKINWLLFVIWLISPIILCLLEFVAYKILQYNSNYNLPIIIIIVLVYLGCTIKRIVIFFIKVYQRYAPDSIRLKCRFEPSCSEYMIQSIQKYGLVKGLVKGIRRLCRCNINGGGYDYP